MKQSSYKIKKSIVEWREKWEERKEMGIEETSRKNTFYFSKYNKLDLWKTFVKTKKWINIKKPSFEIKKKKWACKVVIPEPKMKRKRKKSVVSRNYEKLAYRWYRQGPGFPQVCREDDEPWVLSNGKMLMVSAWQRVRLNFVFCFL